MTKIEVTAAGAALCARVEGPLTGGMVGLPVAFVFDDVWNGLTKTAVFRAGGVSIDRVAVEEETTVPWEVMQKKNCTLQIGVYGVDQDGTVVMPTVWANVGIIQPGADPSGDESTDPTLPVWQQTLQKAVAAAQAAERSAQAAEEVRTAYKNGELDGADGAQGPRGEQGPQGEPGKDGVQINDTVAGEDTTWSGKNIVDKLCPELRESGSIVTCEPVEGYPLGVVSQILPVQEGSGDPSPENVRPITGWSGEKLWRGGKSLINPDAILFNSRYWRRDGTAFISDDTAATYVHIDLHLEAGVAYSFSAYIKPHASGTYSMTVRDKNLKTVVSSLLTSEGKHSISYTCTQSDVYRFTVGGTDYDSGMTISQMQAEFGPTTTEYEPFRGEEFTIDFGQTVYGGSLDWKTGVLTITKAGHVVDGTESWTYTESPGPRCYFWSEPACKLSGGGLCSHARYCGLDVGSTVAQVFNYGDQVALNFPNLSTLEQYVEYFQQQRDAGTPVTVIWTLAEPITIQLTPQEILALSGVNTLYSDTGDTTVTGRADPRPMLEAQNTILERLAALEAAAVNNT